jgi:sarcosine oxidase subunit alpha
MRVRAQNAWPGLGFDLMSLVQHFDRFLPPGFYYKAFMRPRWLWPFYGRLLRAAAGLGRLPEVAPEGWTGKRHIHTEIGVLGGGPAGMAAAAAAASLGARVTLLDEAPGLGGHLRYRGGSSAGQDVSERIARLGAQLQESDVKVMLDTHAFGWYDHGVIGAVQGSELLKVHAPAFIVATGARERFLSMRNNDLPGVMFSAGVQRLVRLWRVRPGRRALVISANRYGYQTALDLHESGASVSVIDYENGREGSGPLRSELVELGVSFIPSALVQEIRGRERVRSVVISDPPDGPSRVVDCDLLVLASPLIPSNDLILQAGGEYSWDERAAGFRAEDLPTGVYVAGGAAGVYGPGMAQEYGHMAGVQAAEDLGYSRNSHRTASTFRLAGLDLEAQAGESELIAEAAAGDGKREFICLCEDVTRADIRYSIEEGYEGMELLKRYATVGMGPCQGKICADLVMRAQAEATGSRLTNAKRTTSRPPVRPVKLETLAADRQAPARATPIHHWHEAQGAKMMAAGPWMRPEHYGDPIEEVHAVRDRVGLIDVSTLGKIFIHGPDAPRLLDRLYTNRWSGLEIGAVRYGVMTNEEGVILDDGITARLSEDWFYMTTTSSGAARVFEWIQWWLGSGFDLDVHAVGGTDLHAAMNLTGPLSRHVLSKVVAGVDLGKGAFPYMRVRQGKVAGVPALLLRIGFTGELGYEIHVPSGFGLHVWEALLAAGAEYDIRPFGVEAQRILRLEKGHIIVGQDTDGLTHPLEAGMEWAVDFRKDDFVGRPSLLRLQEREATQALVGFTMADDVPPAEGTQVVRPGEGPIGLEIIGRVTSARFSPTLGKVIGLGWLPGDMSAVGSEILIRSKGRLREARVAEIPFYDPGGERQRV